LAQILKEQYGRQVAGLTAAIEKISRSEKSFAMHLQAFFEFEPAAAGQSSDGNRLGELEFLRGQSIKKLNDSKDYRQPGEGPITLPGVKDVRIFVLGPPKDKDLIKILDRSSELYPDEAAFDADSSFAAAALSKDDSGASISEELPWVARNRPFENNFGIPEGEVTVHPEYKDFFGKHYGFSEDDGQGAAWRRINTDWLNSAEQLALSINSKTNNTSLVLAIEINAHEVLLFAADAQVGNWLSWQNLAWSGLDPTGKTITGADLLNRTVLYKVGHHGSRNATLNRLGLEQMTHPDLVAMIPVNEKWAREEMGWEHPAPVLLNTLKDKTRGRVIRMDEIPIGETAPVRPEQVPPEIWEEFVSRLNWDRSGDRLWVEYTLALGDS
jgi:hypothetical protein